MLSTHEIIPFNNEVTEALQLEHTEMPLDMSKQVPKTRMSLYTLMRQNGL